MAFSEREMEFIVPAFFVGSAVLMSALGILFAKKRGAREVETAKATAAMLGLSFVDARVGDTASMTDEERKTREMLQKVPFFKILDLFPSWRISGQRGGERVEAFTESRSSGKSSTTYTVARAWLKKAPQFDLRIAHEGLFTKLGKSLFGLEDVETGDPTFDDAARVKSKDPMSAKLLLARPGAKDAIVRLLESNKSAFVTREYVQWEVMGTRLDAATLGDALDKAAAVARALGGD